MATTAVQEGFYHALKPNNKTSDATAMTFVLQGGGPDEVTSSINTTPNRNLTDFRFGNNTSVTWDNVSGNYSEVKVKTTDGATSRTFCTLPLSSTTSPSGTDVELTAATLTVSSTGAAELLATSAGTKTPLDVTLVQDEDGTANALTNTNETGITYSVDQISETMTVVSTGTVSFTGPTSTQTDVDGVRCETGGGSREIVQGQFSPTTALSFTTNATVKLTSYKINFS